MPSQRTAMHDAARSIDIRTALPATRQKPRTIQKGHQTKQRRPFRLYTERQNEARESPLDSNRETAHSNGQNRRRISFGKKRQLKQYNSKASDNRFSMASTTLSTDSVYEGNKRPAKSGRVCTKMARKSIQGYFAMYPRINGQVSNITLQSILASFFRPDRYIRQGKPDETLDQTQPKRKRAKFYRTAKAATRHSSSKSLSSLKQSCHPHNLHAQNQTTKRKAAFTNESCLYHYSRYSKWGNSLAILSQLVDVLSQT